MDDAASRHLRARVQDLDSPVAHPVREGAADDLARFVAVMSTVTRTTARLAGHPAVPATVADKALAGCALLDRLYRAAPELVGGPLRRDAQYWIGTAGAGPDRNRFGYADPARDATTKPFGTGLFTSTGALGTYGAWQLYLMHHDGSSLFPRPWHVWHVDLADDLTVHEVTDAAGWCDFVLGYPTRRGDHVYPDWAAAAREVDAVHVTLRAVAAIQGVALERSGSVVAPAYWDVESTLWLRWPVKDVRLVATEAATSRT